ncbi:S-layer homology domain-containing protein [Pelotomaculum propionicicum]|uniref:Endo-1,4-beta-xylanase A n=1 Tax=Pelotomaculum propionicicum TaxID=258475 RepID=A0A4Y7RNM1_9FIRM|nr:S-layer homology domain-containing protein [Pelotomaculum propionicicum]TEB10588.1 Endo-1,4-beta-xylanase A [Pelotomaculum propionicicum]
MRKKWSVCLLWANFVLAVLLFSLAGPARADAYQLVSKTGSDEIITQGAVLQTVRMSTVEGPLNVYMLKADLSDPYLKIDTIIGSDGTLNSNQAVTEMAKRTWAVAAINGDFFQINESGRTIGLAYQGGHLVESPAQRTDMYGFGLTTDKTPLLEIFGFSGQVTAGNGKSFPLSGINKPSYLVMSEATSDTDALTLYNSLWGTTSRGKLPNLTGVVEVVVKNGVVQQVLTDQPGVPIPADGYILKGHGLAAKFIKENLPKGAKVTFTYSVQPQGDKLFAAVGGQALLVEDGHLPAYFTQNITGRHARTAVGISRDGKTLYLVAVEKQTADGTVMSIGMTQEELADFLISAGVWRAVNLDGGGSTTMAARHLGEFSVSLINRPQGMSQRRVPDAIGIFSTAPQGKLSGLQVSGPSVVLIGRSGEFGVKGYDEYYNPVNIDPGEVEWSAKPEDGSFRGSVFTPSEGGTFTIRAELGKASGTATLRVIGPESISQLVVSPAQINLEPGQSVQLSLQVKTYTGESFDLLPGDVDWTVDSSLGSVAAGKFTAVNNTVSGVLKADFHGVTATVPVTVKPSWVDLQVSPKKDSDISLDGWITINFPAGSLSEKTTIRLAYAPAPTDLAAGLSVLGTCTVNPLQGDTTLEGAWDLDWQYSKDVITSRPAILLWDTATQQWREQPAEIEGDGEIRTISARLWSFGGLILVEDSRKAPSFKDTKGHWASQAISRLALSGVAKGFPDGTFGPGQPITRAQFVSLLAAALQWPAPENQPSFKDAVPQWAQPAIAAAVSRGVVTGYPDGTFLPDARVTRSEMAVMINRALNIGEAEEASYKDSDLIPAFALDAVDSVTEAGILQGSNGYFRPGDGATRAETAVAIDRVIKWWAAQ